MKSLTMTVWVVYMKPGRAAWPAVTRLNLREVIFSERSFMAVDRLACATEEIVPRLLRLESWPRRGRRSPGR